MKQTCSSFQTELIWLNDPVRAVNSSLEEKITVNNKLNVGLFPTKKAVTTSEPLKDIEKNTVFQLDLIFL